MHAIAAAAARATVERCHVCVRQHTLRRVICFANASRRSPWSVDRGTCARHLSLPLLASICALDIFEISSARLPVCEFLQEVCGAQRKRLPCQAGAWAATLEHTGVCLRSLVSSANKCNSVRLEKAHGILYILSQSPLAAQHTTADWHACMANTLIFTRMQNSRPPTRPLLVLLQNC